MDEIQEFRDSVHERERRRAALQQEAAAALLERETALTQKQLWQYIPKSVAQALNAQFYGSLVTLEYRGVGKCIRRDSICLTTPDDITEWLDRVDQQIAEAEAQSEKEAVELIERINAADARTLHQLRYLVSVHSDRVDVKRALVWADLRHKAEQAKRAQALRSLTADIRRRRKGPADWDWINGVELPEGTRGIVGEELVERFFQALEDTRNAWVNYRSAAEKRAFWPFSYYTHITSSGRTFDTLDPDPTDGWYTTVQGNDIKPLEAIVMTERIRVDRVEDIPEWCPLRKTKWGAIRVPPRSTKMLEEEAL